MKDSRALTEKPTVLLSHPPKRKESAPEMPPSAPQVQHGGGRRRGGRVLGFVLPRSRFPSMQTRGVRPAVLVGGYHLPRRAPRSR